MEVVAQLVRASVCGTEGRGFESRPPPLKSLFLKAFFISPLQKDFLSLSNNYNSIY